MRTFVYADSYIAGIHPILSSHVRQGYFMKQRQGDISNNWFRSNRFYNVKGQWFFSTREGVDFGPFENQQDAAQALHQFIQRAESQRGSYA